MKLKKKGRRKKIPTKNETIIVGKGSGWKSVIPYDQVTVDRKVGRALDSSTWGNDPFDPPPMEE